MSASLISILSNFQIIGSAIGFTLGTMAYNWITVFMETFIKPIISKLIKQNINDITLKIGGIKFNMSKFLFSSLDFIIVILFILFILRVILKDVVTEVIKHNTSNEQKMTNLLEDISKWRIPIIQK